MIKTDKQKRYKKLEIQDQAYELSESLKNYCKHSIMSKPEFVELTLMLLDYWHLDDDLSTALKHKELSFAIEDKIIELGKKYDT